MIRDLQGSTWQFQALRNVCFKGWRLKGRGDPREKKKILVKMAGSRETCSRRNTDGKGFKGI